jgi:hypothetical protein
MAAVRVSIQWIGTRRALSSEQRAQAADTFGAEGPFLSAAKKLLDTAHPAFKAVTAVRGQAVAYWRGVTLPYPEAGIRLIRQTDISNFDARFTELRGELAAAVEHLDANYSELRSTAREQLGRLYNPADYPESLQGLFGIHWDFPSVEPPDYLRELNPELYAQEQQRVANRFDEAIRLAEEAFAAELTQLMVHLTERLEGDTDGKPKVFRNSAVTNLLEFFDRFRTLNVRSDAELDALVDQARQIVQGVDPQTLRDRRPLRERVSAELAVVQDRLDALLVDRPRRNLIRRPK